MTDYLLYNGRFHKNEALLVAADNRGLRYGDGLFETLKFSAGEILMQDWHLERLFRGMDLLQFECPALFTPALLAGQVAALCKKNKHKTARVRINIFRGNGGLYDPENHAPHCIIQSWALPGNGFELNENGLVAGIYTEARKSMDAFAHLKSNNYLPYAMAALHAKKQQWNEAFLLNSAGRICDASIANIFIIKNDTIYTPSLQEGCVAGIMRRFLLENLPLHGFRVEEASITPEDLLAADEVFVSNAVRGLRWVKECGPSNYTNYMSTQVFARLLKK
jgi:branched-chain amino acid aminotransferase